MAEQGPRSKHMNAMEQLECGLLWRSVWADVYFHVSRSTSANIIDALSLDSIDDRISIWRQLLWIDPSLSAWLLDGVCRGHWSDSSDGPLDPGEILRRLTHWATASQLSRHLERVTCFGPFLTDPIREDVDELKDLSGQSSLGRPAFQQYRCDMGLVARIYLGYRNTIPWRKANDVSGDVWHRVESWQRADEREVAKRLTYIPTEAAASGLQTPSDETVERSERSDTSCDSLLSAASLQSRLMRLARLEELDDAFDRKVEQEKLAAMKELAYGASHEINNPLANIASRAQLLLRDESDPQRRRSLAVIHSQAMRAHEMIADMMLFAKPPKLTCRIIDLSELLVRFRELLQRDLPADVQIDWAVPHEPMRIKADGEQLLLALRAISLNAVEAMRESGRIEVRLIAADVNGPLDVTGVMGNRLTAEWVWIGVLDTGPGIAKDLRTHLFDPFYSGREAGRGLGFGLSKAWRIVDLHGGRIDVHSTEKGAVFWVGLPWACRKLES